jgi:lipopolysaccharide/colanic/teichoic acid biosynthesis glycosyltransferase
MAVVALAVAVTSGRPILYGQLRVGKDGRPFRLWKFRTMRAETEVETETAPVWAGRNDPRRTRVGRVLRRFSLDELPQLWNVLCGDMSMVGPRPERPVFVTRFCEDDPWYAFRHRIRPGITGLAQVRGLRGDTPLEPRIESDNWYIEHWSLGLDVRVAVRTMLEVLRGRNAG